MSTDKEIGARLRRARIAKGYKSAADAARALNMAYPTYAGHENGSRGLKANLERYARFFGVTFEWLLTEKGDAPAPLENEDAALRALLLAMFDRIEDRGLKAVAVRQVEALADQSSEPPASDPAPTSGKLQK